MNQRDDVKVKPAAKAAIGSAGRNVERLAGNPDGHGNVDGIGAAARFYSPTGAAVDGAGNVYVADTWSHTIRKIPAPPWRPVVSTTM